MFKPALTILFISFLTACSHKIAPVREVIKDSIVEKVVTIIKRDTTYLPGDSVEVGVAIPCPDAKLDTTISKGNSKLTAKIDKGYLKMKCNSDSLQHIVDSILQLREKERYSTHITTNTITVTKTVVEYKIPKWCWWLLGLNIIYLIYRFRTPIWSTLLKMSGK